MCMILPVLLQSDNQNLQVLKLEQTGGDDFLHDDFVQALKLHFASAKSEIGVFNLTFDDETAVTDYQLSC